MAHWKPKQLTAGTLFLKNKLFLHAKDFIPAEEMSAANISDIKADAWLLTMNDKGMFTLVIFDSQCCDYSDYTFDWAVFFHGRLLLIVGLMG